MPPKRVAGAAGKAGPKKKNGYVMPEKINVGEILTDLGHTTWKIGPSIGSGGFGAIYSATKAEGGAKNIESYDYVVKIEPHGNGPLFVEMHFYMRNAKQEDIINYAKLKNLKSFGMPHYVGSGSHDINNIKHRFLVMPRYGRDIWSIFLENAKKLPEHTIYRLAIQMLDVYEYIHKNTYVHGDLKGANMLLGLGKSGQSQVYLVDFGLAAHSTTKDFKPDPKKAHNGTIEYLSRDAHLGIPTMRGDMEILGYNLIHWSGVTLPWEAEKLLTNPVKVQKSKENFMSKLNDSLKKLYTNNIPEPIGQFMSYISNLEYDETPNYDKCRKMFLLGLKSLGKSNVGDLDFKLTSKSTPVRSKKIRGYASPENVDETPKQKRNRRRDSPDHSLELESISPSPRKRNTTKADTSGKNSVRNDSPSPSARTKRRRGADEQSKKVNTPIAKANLNFSPRVIINTKSSTPSSSRPGKTIVNDNLTPNVKSSKTYELNLELNVSMDADVIVNVKRKKKNKDTAHSTDDEDPKVSLTKKVSESTRNKTPKKTQRSK